jgi:hypothetical protein
VFRREGLAVKLCDHSRQNTLSISGAPTRPELAPPFGKNQFR